MAAFDSLIEILSSRFGLGATARLLVSEIVAMISAPPGGLGGFLDKLKSAGLASEVASWLGHPDAAPLAAGQVERALGATALSGIASRMGLEQSIVTPALAYALPRIVGLLTPGGVVPAGVPGEITAFLSQPRAAAAAEQVAPKRIDALPTTAPNERGVGRWLWLAVAAIVAIGLLSYFWSAFNRTEPIAKAPEPATSAPATVAKAPAPPPGSRASGASPRDNRANDCAPGSASCAARRPCPGSLDGRTSDRFAIAGARGECATDGLSRPRSVAVNQRTSDSSRSAGFACDGSASARHHDRAHNDRTGFNASRSCSRREG